MTATAETAVPGDRYRSAVAIETHLPKQKKKERKKERKKEERRERNDSVLLKTSYNREERESRLETKRQGRRRRGKGNETRQRDNQAPNHKQTREIVQSSPGQGYSSRTTPLGRTAIASDSWTRRRPARRLCSPRSHGTPHQRPPHFARQLASCTRTHKPK